MIGFALLVKMNLCEVGLDDTICIFMVVDLHFQPILPY
jgi:hypothetical protein